MAPDSRLIQKTSDVQCNAMRIIYYQCEIDLVLTVPGMLPNQLGFC